jgi:hypothetical protein
MKSLSRLIRAFLVAIIIANFFLPACKSGGDNKRNSKAESDSLYPEATLSPELKAQLYDLPTPFQVTLMLEKAKAGYIYDITNSPGNIGKYITEKRKALNLGVYSADLAYSATYNRIDQTNMFLGCTMKLAEELGIAGVYGVRLVDEVRATDNNKDSLVNLISKTLIQCNTILALQNKNYLALLMATGAFVEGLFLASELCVVAQNNTGIVEGILKQKENLEALIPILGHFQECPTMKLVYDAVVRLEPVFTDYGMVQGKILDRKKAIELNILIESVRHEFVTNTPL